LQAQTKIRIERFHGIGRLVASGFSRKVIVDLLRARYLTTTPERTFAAGRPVHIKRVRITESGRRAQASGRR
jgi:hypothetical protein